MKLLNGPGDMEAGTGPAIPQKKCLHFISPIFVQAFTLTFLAEWGDRSQLTTIVLAAREVSQLYEKCARSEVTEQNAQDLIRYR